MAAGFDHRVVRDTHDRTVGTIQGHRHPRGLVQQLIEFFLKRRRRFIHESASTGVRAGTQNTKAAAPYHRIGWFRY